MPEEHRDREGDWDEDHSPEKARMVTLRDEKGKLYRVRAGLLSSQRCAYLPLPWCSIRGNGPLKELQPATDRTSDFFADMFACSTHSDDPIDADFSSAWLKQLLRFIDQHDSFSALSIRAFEISFRDASAITLARLHVWAEKYDFTLLTEHINTHGHRLMQRRSPHELLKELTDLFVYAVDINDVNIAKIGFHLIPRTLYGAMDFIRVIELRLPLDWRWAFVRTMWDMEKAEEEAEELEDDQEDEWADVFEYRIHVSDLLVSKGPGLRRSAGQARPRSGKAEERPKESGDRRRSRRKTEEVGATAETMTAERDDWSGHDTTPAVQCKQCYIDHAMTVTTEAVCAQVGDPCRKVATHRQYMSFDIPSFTLSPTDSPSLCRS